MMTFAQACLSLETAEMHELILSKEEEDVNTRWLEHFSKVLNGSDSTEPANEVTNSAKEGKPTNLGGSKKLKNETST